MNQITIRLTLLLLLIPICNLQAQIEKGQLVQGKLIESEITSDENHQYTINLKKDQFVFFKFMQDGIDLKVTTYNTLNDKLEEFDSPNYRNGYELATIASDMKGKYIIEVESIDEKGHTGKYNLFVQSIKPKAVTQNEQVDELFSVCDTRDTPGVAVAVVKNGTVLYKNGYGIANLEYDIPVESSTVFDIASLSKQFTGFAISTLLEQGKISLDDDIRMYIPELPDFGYTVTIDHLVHHTSGLRD